MAVMVITNGRLIGPRTILEQHCVIIDGGKVKQIAPTSQVLWPEDAQVINVEGGFVAPGFVDLHVHGALGRDAMEGSVETLAQIAIGYEQGELLAQAQRIAFTDDQAGIAHHICYLTRI